MADFEKNIPRNHLLADMDTYGVQFWHHLLPLRVAIITQSASKPPGGPESCGIELTMTIFEKYRPITDVGPIIQAKEGLV